MSAETKRQRVVRLAEQGAERAMGERRDFTITKFGRHDDGYMHARVTPAGSKPIYVHRRYGSWMAPGSVRGQTVMKELEALGLAREVKIELQKKARAIEYQERQAARGAIRDEAVRIVDERYGYTVEFSSSPDAHRDDYDKEEARLLKEKGVRNGRPDRSDHADANDQDEADAATGSEVVG